MGVRAQAGRRADDVDRGCRTSGDRQACGRDEPGEPFREPHSAPVIPAPLPVDPPVLPVRASRGRKHLRQQQLRPQPQP
jgi:hypothetical protein